MHEPALQEALRRVGGEMRFTGDVAEALAALLDPTSVPALADLLGEPPDVVARAVAKLRARALLWGTDDALHLVRPVREAFEPYPGGLAPPSAC